LTVTEPVNVPLLLTEIELTEPLSLGAVAGLIVLEALALICKCSCKKVMAVNLRLPEHLSVAEDVCDSIAHL
jgi:hypothetical protein